MRQSGRPGWVLSISVGAKGPARNGLSHWGPLRQWLDEKLVSVVGHRLSDGSQRHGVVPWHPLGGAFGDELVVPQ